MKKVDVANGIPNPTTPMGPMNMDGGSAMGALGSMMNGMMGGMPPMGGPMPTPPVDQTVVNDNNEVVLADNDVKEKDEESVVSLEAKDGQEVTPTNPAPLLVADQQNQEDELEKEKARTIRTVTPFIINTTEASNGKKVATISFLCVLENDEVITISRNFILETPEDEDIIRLIDFHADSEFINNKICYNTIVKYLPSYFTVFNFKANPLKNNKEVILDCVQTDNRSNMVEFKMSPEAFMAMSFIDDYVFKGEVENAYDLQLATVSGSKTNDNIEFFVVEAIENIVTMVSTAQKPKGLDAIKNIFFKEEHTGIGLVFKVSRTVNGEKEIVSILTPFDIGIVLDKSKFKGDTIESVQQEYYGDGDQFVSTLLIDEFHIYDIDKDYMMIRGKNKNGKYYVFLLDSSTKEDLIHKIKEY